MEELLFFTGLWQLENLKDFIAFQSKVNPLYFFSLTTLNPYSFSSLPISSSSSSSGNSTSSSTPSTTTTTPHNERRRLSLVNTLLSSLSSFTLRILLSSPCQYRLELYPEKEIHKPLRIRDILIDNQDYVLPSTENLHQFSSTSSVTINQLSTLILNKENTENTKPTLRIITKYKDNEGSLQECIETYHALSYTQLQYTIRWTTNQSVSTAVTSPLSSSLQYTGIWTRIETTQEQAAYKYITELYNNITKLTIENNPPTDNNDKLTLSTSSLSTSESTIDHIPPKSEWYCPDFSGNWAVDNTLSESMEPIFTLMGLPWLARKAALALEVFTIIDHNRERNEVNTCDKASIGVLSTNNMIADGITVDKVGKDGKIAQVTCRLFEPPIEDIEKLQALGCMQITTVLPDGAGTSDNIWTLYDEGKKMRQKITYTRGDKVAIITRTQVNKEWKPQPPRPIIPVVTPASITTASSATTETKSGTGLHINVSSTIEASKTILPASPMNDTSTTSSSRSLHKLQSWIATEWERDPFFIPLSGNWIVDHARSQSLDPLWKSMGISSLARLLVNNVEIISRISHSKFLFISQDKSTLGLHKITIPLDGQWRPIKQADGRWMLCRGTHTHGSGDKGPTWLGYEAGMIPPVLLRAGHVDPSATPSEQRQHRKSSLQAAAVAAAAIAGGESAYFPYYSSLPFDINKYSTSSVTIETLLMDISDIVQKLQITYNNNNKDDKKSTPKIRKQDKKRIVPNGINNSATNNLLPNDTDSTDSSSRRSSNASEILNTDIAYQINTTTINNKALINGINTTNRKYSPAITAALNSGMPVWQALPYTDALPRGARLIVQHKLENRTTLIQQYTHIAGTDKQNHDIVLSKVERSLILQDDTTNPSLTLETIRIDRQRVNHARAIILSRRGEADKLRKQILVADAERLADEAVDDVLDQEEEEKKEMNSMNSSKNSIVSPLASKEISTPINNSTPNQSIAANPWSAIPDHDETHGEENVEYDGTNGCQIM